MQQQIDHGSTRCQVDTTAQVIDKLEKFLAQDIKGEDIDEFCCDNDACFITDEFKRWAHKKGWKLRMSATYKQHQNAVAQKHCGQSSSR
jgi:hypothetical protein